MKKSPFEDLNKVVKQTQLESLEKGNIYPCVIIMDRYSGSYSGGKWLAFELNPEDIPEEIGSGDGTERVYWDNHSDEQLPIGIGETPQAAYDSLLDKLKEYYSQW